MELSSLPLYTILAKSKNPFKILAEAEPRQRRGEAGIAQKSQSENWRCLLIKIRTYFEQNPDCEL